jgi:DNA polymerase-1
MISDMQRNGIRLDCPQLHALTRRILTRQSEIESQVGRQIGAYQYLHEKHGYQPFKISSRDHLAQLLFEHLKIQGDTLLARTPTNKRFEVSDDVLALFKKSHPIAELVSEWHSIEKLRNTYSAVLPTMVDSNSRLHTKFNVTVAATGRLSSSEPNLQNIPIRSTLTLDHPQDWGLGRQIRAAFIASPGCVLVSCDLSQIEMRIAAHGSQDSTMLEVFQRDEDIHAKTACGVFGRDYYDVMSWDKKSDRFMKWKKEERAPSKNLGFGVLYGLTAEGLQRNILTESEGEIDWEAAKCQGFIDQFFKLYPGLRSLMDLQYRRARRFGMVWDMFGRVRLVPEAKSAHKRISNEGERKAGNHFEQSSAQGVLKLAMAELIPVVAAFAKSHTCLSLLQIHDQMIWEVDKRVAEEFGMIGQYTFEHAAPLENVPTLSSLDISDNWGDL